jgi:hypothetical protein
MRYTLLYIFSLVSTTLLFSQKDWKRVVDKDNIKVWTKTYDKDGIKQFKAETVYNENINTVVAALMDVEYSNNWYDMVEKVTILKRYSDTDAIYRIDFDFPALVSDRYTTVRASIKRDEATGNYIVKTKYERYDIPSDDSRVYVNKLESEWTISKIDENSTKVYHAAFMDPNGSIPAWMVNTSVTSGPVKTLKGLGRNLSKYRSNDIKN